VQGNKDFLEEVGLKSQNANSSIKAPCGIHFGYPKPKPKPTQVCKVV
jgi:hypothetical protein